LSQQLQKSKVQAEAAQGARKQADDLKAVLDQGYAKLVTAPGDSLRPLFPADRKVLEENFRVDFKDLGEGRWSLVLTPVT
ncbi:DUF3053 family protein, partial [Klebsiella pneumoniae]|uniref:DUF3053 family protein n=1 Tax=Klebsiella pneumoniae TaxID=573 RepID=UPI001D196908